MKKIIFTCIVLFLGFACNHLYAQSLKTATAALEEIDNLSQFDQLKANHPDWKVSIDKTLISDSERFPKIVAAKEGDIIKKQYNPNAPSYVLKVLNIEDEELCKLKYIYLDGTKYSKPEIDSIRTKIIKRYKEGEKFLTLVNEYTMDGNPTGDLGWFYKGMMVSEFDDVIQNRTKGEIFTVDVDENNWFYVVLKNHDNKVEKAINGIMIRYDK